MTGPRAQTPANPADHPLRAALERGERLRAESAPALQYLIAAQDQSLIGEAVVAQVRGMLSDLADQLAVAAGLPTPHERSSVSNQLLAHLLLQEDLRAHSQALALEWRLALILEDEFAIDPVLAPIIQAWVADSEAATSSLAMAVLAAQARFAQSQRRMQLPLAELPAELFHAVITVAREALQSDSHEAQLRAGYDEAATRLALLSRLAREAGSRSQDALAIEQAGVALWLSVLSARSGESRERTACAAADPHLGRLLLTLRAAGASPADAERQALYVQPNRELPRGLGDVGTREAAQWLAEAQL